MQKLGHHSGCGKCEAQMHAFSQSVQTCSRFEIQAEPKCCCIKPKARDLITSGSPAACQRLRERAKIAWRKPACVLVWSVFASVAVSDTSMIAYVSILALERTVPILETGESAESDTLGGAIPSGVAPRLVRITARHHHGSCREAMCEIFSALRCRYSQMLGYGLIHAERE